MIREQDSDNPVLSKIYGTSDGTSTGNWLQHAAKSHDLFENAADGPTVKQRKLTPWLTNVKNVAPAASQWEFNRDLGLMICRDLLPFELVEKTGFVSFVNRNCQFAPPTPKTLSSTVLLDIYGALKDKIKQMMLKVVSGTIMMDGWTDRYNALPYFAIRLSTIVDWNYHVITLAVQPVESHTSKSLAKFVKDVLLKFFGESYRSIKLFNTTDGAANMLKLSKLLNHDRNTCIAHCLHNLLTVDIMIKVDEVQQLIEKCKAAVTTLHFKAYMLDEERLREDDKRIVENETTSKMTEVFSILRADENVLANCDETDDADSHNETTQSMTQSGSTESTDQTESNFTTTSPHLTHQHQHRRLKSSVPTRWNSVLTMINSVIDLLGPMNEVLKKIGHFDMCIDDEDKEMLVDLKTFLTPFLHFTNVFSQNVPTLSLIPLMKMNIKAVCKADKSDSGMIQQLKRLTLQVCLLNCYDLTMTTYYERNTYTS